MTFKALRRLSAYAGLLLLYLISSSARAQVYFPPVFYDIPSSSQLPASCAGAIGWVIASPGTGSGSVYTCQAGAPALVSGGGGGSGTVTSVTFAGTANQITATGTCTGTTVINCTLSIPTAFQLPGTIDGLTITTTTGTFTLANAKTLTVSNTMTFTAADSSTVAFGTGGTVLYTTSSAGSFPTLNQSTTGNAATATNLATYPALCSGGQFSEGYTTGSPPTNNCATPGAAYLDYQNETGPVTMNGSPQTVYTGAAPITLPAGGCLTIDVAVTGTGAAAANATIAVYADSTLIHTVFASGSLGIMESFHYCNTSGSTTQQRLLYPSPVYYGSSGTLGYNAIGTSDGLIPAAVTWGSTTHTLSLMATATGGTVSGAWWMVAQ